MGTFLNPPKITVSGGNIVFSAFELVHDGRRVGVEDAEVGFGPAQAKHWFYIQVVRFKLHGSYGYHVSEGVPGTGPAQSQDTNEVEFLGTVISGNINDDGTAIADFHKHTFPLFLLEVK